MQASLLNSFSSMQISARPRTVLSFKASIGGQQLVSESLHWTALLNRAAMLNAFASYVGRGKMDVYILVTITLFI